MRTLSFIMIILVFLSCTQSIPQNNHCNFSSNTSEPERCFGGVGDRCNKGVFLLAPMSPNYKNCTIDGYMSIGSIEHDKCCIKTLNQGHKCAFPEDNTKLCTEEWNKAVKDTLCSAIGAKRQWKIIFGPYPKNNNGDSVSQQFYAPKDFKVASEYQKYCKNGCKTNELGKVIFYQDICGQYCTCN